MSEGARPLPPRLPWYAEGLRFTCTACGNCCRNRGDYEVVWVRPSEVRRLAAFKGLAPAAFRSLYLEEVEGAWSLASREGACIFLDGEGRCAVYEARPRQCRTWPFWPQTLRRREWQEEVLPLCPGAGRGRLYTLGEIREVARAAVGRGPLPRLPVCRDR